MPRRSPRVLGNKPAKRTLTEELNMEEVHKKVKHEDTLEMERTRAVLRRALSKSATPRNVPAPKETVVVDMPEDVMPTNRIKERSPIKKLTIGKITCKKD